MIRTSDTDRVRIITLERPEALNAFNEALYDATCEALGAAAADPGVAVVVITGSGRAFSAGTDLVEMAARNSGTFTPGRHGFPGMVDQLAGFPKPLLLAVNGIGLGIGATIIGFADLVFMSDQARLRCPFSSLALAPEAAASVTFPRLMGRQRATWALLSSEWLSAAQCLKAGLVFQVCAHEELMDVTLAHARTLASKSIASLVESKALILAGLGPEIAAARERENAAYKRLLGAPANQEALAAFMERREPDFAAIDAAGAGV